MDIVRLGEYDNSNPSYLPDMIVDGFTSKIWTERFLEFGEFQLVTPYVDEIMEVLPEQTFISHRHTREVMQVETHSITTDDNGVETLTLSGRSVDCILDSRFVEGSYNKRRKMAKKYTPGSAALALVWNAIDNTGDSNGDYWDVSRIRKDGEDHGDMEGDGDRWPGNSKDKVPNVVVTDGAATGTGTSRNWWLKEGMLYEQLTRILRQGDLGIRTMRPPTGTTGSQADGFVGERVYVHSNLPEFGDVERVVDTNYPELRFDLYRGVDRTDKVVFNLRRDHFRSAQHLYSVADWKTALEVMSGLNLKWDIYRTGQSGFTGWQRRVMAMDAGDPDIPDPPDKPGKNASQAQKDAYDDKYDRWITRRNRVRSEFIDDYKKDGKKELNRHKRVYLFSGEVSDEAVADYAFGPDKDYYLGDTVTLRGRNGTTNTATVAEYVLTEDGTGQRGYPGLELKEE